MDGQRWWRGLLARMTLAYAIGATLLATVVAGASYGLAQNRLLTEAETQEREQFYFNAKDVRERLDTITAETSEEDADTIYTAALNELSLRNGAKTALIPADGDVRSPQLLNNRDLPDELEVLAQEPSTSTGQLRYQQDGVTNYALGIRLEGVDAVYYDVLPLGDLEATLRSLRVILVAVAWVTSI